ncbi:MAG TPA: type II CAAX endopeptidase family protein [Planctomycetota bacterium]|nr:type II CAAX endopeptidase family protein [Planctomycetota bacterium]
MAATTSELPRGPVEVVPDDTHQPGLIEKWLQQNTAPLLVLFLSLSMLIIVESLQMVISRPLPEKTPSMAAEDPVTGKEKPRKSPRKAALDQVSALGFKPPPHIGFAIFAGAILLALALGFPEARAFLARIFLFVARRPLPALHFLDFAAVFVVFLASARIFAATLLSSGILPPGAERSAAQVLMGLAFGTALAAGIYLAQHRAGSARGSFGIWPFWKLAPTEGPRPIWQDIAVGILAYPPSMLIMGLCLYVNHAIVYLLDRPQDEHMLIGELAKPQSITALIITFIMATAGAAFFEELLFRGMLYNVLRRYVSVVPAACIAGFAFAAVHVIWSQILGLFVLALILTWLYDRTGRLVASMTLHAVNNFVALVLTLLLTHYSKG